MPKTILAFVTSEAVEQGNDLPIMPTEFRRGVEVWFGRASRALMRATHPLYASISSETVTELPGDADDRTVPRDAKTFEARPDLYRSFVFRFEWVVEPQKVLDGDIEDFLVLLDGYASSMASQTERGILEHISQVCDASGNTIRAVGGDLQEGLLAGLESLEFTFDEEGRHNLSMVSANGFQSISESTFLSDAHKARYNSIIAKKRKDWDATRNLGPLPGLPD